MQGLYRLFNNAAVALNIFSDGFFGRCDKTLDNDA